MFDESELELELLSLDPGPQTIGEHELKTSPLITYDAAKLTADQFTQRGLLGGVLAVNASGLPPTLKDPRIYINLDAPSSGLVCGVQGSGKSHTVSCIIEGSLMMDRRIGTLPAPLATVVFHYDEENGGRPCEAAYLSELKTGSARGVEEVVVLVSPSNLNTRRRVYSSLTHVKVEPLRISETDLNASRMLSMMGADNLETMPLYLFSAMAILREMGSDGFSYQGFRKKLAESDFNRTQQSMLQLRLDLLDSFLKGTGKDIVKFFNSGRLVIVDLSDPFVDGVTAAMLFNICLGLFIEWKNTTGKLIVLDEAHKYLTNADANQFTRSICSIIRQQRHLAARVVVSTQEPTVVPPSVLDLMSWIICHRFTSPSWVKHLMHHICVDETSVGEDDNNGSGSNAPDWAKQVMRLRTGEGLLCSASALFPSKEGTLERLGTGYAVIKSRMRLTRDGGESILATDSTSTAEHVPLAGLATPESSTSSGNPSPELGLRLGSQVHCVDTSNDTPSTASSPSLTEKILSPRMSTLEAGSRLFKPPTYTDIGSQSENEHVTKGLNAFTDVSSTPVLVIPRARPKSMVHNIAPAFPVSSTPPQSVFAKTRDPQFDVLIKGLVENNGRALHQSLLDRVHQLSPNPYPTGEKKPWKNFLTRAEAAGIVTLSGSGSKKMVTLIPGTTFSQAQKTASTLIQQSIPSGESSYAVLISALSTLAPGRGVVRICDLGQEFKKRKFKHDGRLKDFLIQAEQNGVVKLSVRNKMDHVQLA